MIDVEKLKQKILDLAIRGKLVPQDPNDEPASVLIKKIKAEKAKLVKEGKIKPSKEESYIYKGSDNFYYEKTPSNWVFTKLKYLALEIMGGGTPSKSNKEYWNGKIPWCSVKDLGDDLIISSTKNTITSDGLNNSASRIAEVSDLIYCSRIRVGAVRIPAIPMAINQDLKIIKLPNSVNQEYIALALSNYPINTSGTTVFGTSLEDIKNIVIPLPPIKEQNRIVKKYKDCIYLINQIRADSDSLFDLVGFAKNKILESIFCCDSSYKSYYPNNYLLGEILEYEQPGPYIVSSTDYNDEYKTPVLTPGKTFILGYTNEKEGIYHIDSKVIIFDDFTTASRLVNFDFKVKSSAMKILHSVDENKFNIDYMYYLLQTIKVISDTHKRFWISEYAPKRICMHTYEEQLKIVDLIHSSFGLLDLIIQ